MAQLKSLYALTTNGDEIDCTKAACKLRRVIQSFLHHTWHFEKHINGRDTL